MSTTEPLVLAGVRGRVGELVLNRPSAINALNLEMVQLMATALRAWAHDDAVDVVVLRGAGERGLCAGGDIVAMYRDIPSGGAATEAFWRAEYRLDHLIAEYPKPVLAVMDGIVMGGGVGISGHARARVVTGRTRFAMPETLIGYVPDVAGLRLLAAMPGELGTFAALTGHALGGADAVATGVADVLIDVADLPEWLETLTAATDPARALAELRGRTGRGEHSPLLAEHPWIDACFSAASVPAILAALDARAEPAAASAAAELRRRSPMALVTTLAAVRMAATTKTLAAQLQRDFRVSVRAFGWPDFAEGIRAQVIDKDRRPRWQPPAFEAVGSVEWMFEPLADRAELWLPEDPLAD